MAALTATQIDDYSVEGAMSGGGTDKLLDIAVSANHAWIGSKLDELVSSGEYTGESVLAHEAVMDIAYRLEHGRIADDARKPIADMLRYLSQFVLQRKT
ncbi:hypothetical protein CN140_01560 [Sinorhizobium meliloti]|uniref:hypothetical protein n=1 Tax=Rhizobium meliloti TaxID=382 RepID=UPI000FDCB7D0|nr:hypothetical protein [Sinorhizobium meliloti]RVL87645.1 hypothetical protein CN140_01560 [Sinorhizobium meliloti]